MKQKDIALIAVIVVISAVFSLFLSNRIFVSSANRQQEVEVVQPINSGFTKPDKDYFNAAAVDPTQPITISPNSNPNPFSTSTTNP